MQHFKLEIQSLGALVTAYPHSPEDQVASQEDYVEDMLSQGYELASVWGTSTSAMNFWFKVVAK